MATRPIKKSAAIFIEGAIPNPDLIKELKPIFSEMPIEDVVDAGACAGILEKNAKKVGDAAKEIIRDVDAPEISGREYLAKIAGTSESYIDPKTLFDVMLAEGFIKITKGAHGYRVTGKFFDVVKVSVTAAEKFMGSASLSKITTKREGTARVSFKEM